MSFDAPPAVQPFSCSRIVPLAVQLPAVAMPGRQQMEQIVVIEAGYRGCQQPRIAWHMQIDPRHLVVSWAGHVEKCEKKSPGLGASLALAWRAPCNGHSVIHEEVERKPGKGEFSTVQVQMAKCTPER